jgi:hypothetical protein
MALMDPSVHINKVPRHMQVRVSEGLLTSKQWVHKIVEAATYVPKMKLFNTPKSRGSRAVEDAESFEQEGLVDKESAMVPEGMDTDDRMEEDKEGIKFFWEDDISQLLGEGTKWVPVARSHRAALELLQQAITSNSKEVKSIGVSVDYKINEAIKKQLGKLDHLIHEHGSLANGMSMAIEAGSLSVEDVAELQAKMDTFGGKLQAFAKAADVSKEYMMSLMTKVLDIARKGMQRATAWMQHIEQLLGHGTRGTRGQPPTPPPPPPLRRNTSSPFAANSLGIDGDSPLGTVQVSGSDTALTVKLLFRMIRELQAKVDILTECSKNAGVIFD